MCHGRRVHLDQHVSRFYPALVCWGRLCYLQSWRTARVTALQRAKARGEAPQRGGSAALTCVTMTPRVRSGGSADGFLERMTAAVSASSEIIRTPRTGRSTFPNLRICRTILRRAHPGLSCSARARCPRWCIAAALAVRAEQRRGGMGGGGEGGGEGGWTHSTTVSIGMPKDTPSRFEALRTETATTSPSTFTSGPPEFPCSGGAGALCASLSPSLSLALSLSHSLALSLSGSRPRCGQ